MRKAIKNAIPSTVKVILKRIVYSRRFKKHGLQTEFPEIVHPSIFVEPTVVFLDKVSVGENVTIGRNTYVSEGRISPGVIIGRYCSIARQTNIGGTEHPVHWLTSSTIAYSDEYFPAFKWSKKFPVKDVAETRIGNDVWIGASVIIKRGIKIGDGAVIGAGAVVTKDIPPYAIAVGVPAKVINFRFDQDVINQLLELEWWNLDESNLQDIDWNDINKAIEQLQLKIK